MSKTSPAAAPLASLSLDLDNQWSYMKTHGDAGWEGFPSYFDVLVPAVLEALESHGLTITFFVVGQDAALPRNHSALGQLTDAGHEVGNHSFHHEQWMGARTREETRREIREAERAIEDATGQRPLGYRGPGFTWSPDLLEVLAEAGYLYDASTLPTYLGPLARRYYFRRSSLSDEEMKQREDLFGGFGEGRRPVKPYRWALSGGARLLEVPVTTVPLFKTPFHLSYLLYLSRASATLAVAYLRSALALCRLTRTEPSFLLHPLDLLGAEHAPELAFFPGMELSSSHKRRLFDRVVAELGRHFRLVTMSEHARSILRREPPLREVGR